MDASLLMHSTICIAHAVYFCVILLACYDQLQAIRFIAEDSGNCTKTCARMHMTEMTSILREMTYVLFACYLSPCNLLSLGNVSASGNFSLQVFHEFGFS